jgi:Flp pilus assembly protein TadB
MNKQVGGFFAGGCLFWVITGVIILGIILLSLASVIGDFVASKRADSEARRAQEESEKLSAQAQLEAARTYNEAAGRSLKADTYRAHPELYLVDAVRWIVMIALGIVAALALLFLYWNRQERSARR